MRKLRKRFRSKVPRVKFTILSGLRNESTFISSVSTGDGQKSVCVYGITPGYK